MSVLTYTRVNQSKTNVQADNRVEDDMVEISATGTSVIARIDYIQRFSKQMTVVVDKNSAVYSKIARQYLANISQDSSHQEMNVAFVAASSKINDIQMRCRLIEQLFANTLFDPEQSLALSILRLAKKNNGVITVIVEHAQALSLQIKYELCQLVDTAKKTQNNINVVIFGLEQAAIEIGQNKTIFDKKTSIVDASSGQVIALDHTRFKNKSSVFKNGIWLKISLASLICLLIILVSWFVLSEHESVNFAALPVASSGNENPKIVPKIIKPITSNNTQNKLASVSDVHLAILGQDNNQKLLLATAKRDDILQALMLSDSAIHNSQIVVNLEKTALVITSEQITSKQVTPAEVKPTEVKPEKLNNLTSSPETLNEQYYLNSEEGYVVQITGFSDLSRLQAFIKNNKDLELFSYQRNLNGQQFFVLTSEVYGDKTQARVAISKLPQDLKDLGSFLKSVSTIKREINTVNP
jgi:DamX protein